MPDRGAVLAQFEALLTRAAYNVGFFSPNDLILSGVFDVAWLWNRVTLQGEVTLAQLIRVKGEIAEPDEFITLATGGVHLGYFALPMLSGGVELRYVGLLTTPELVKKDPSTREQFSVGVGVRTHLQAGRLSLHPGIYYVRGLDDPMARAGFNIIGLDLPVVFGSAGRASTQSAPPGQ